MAIIKKGILVVLAALMSALAWITNILQFVRNVLLQVIDLPFVGVSAVAGALGVFASISCFFSIEGFFNALGFAILVCVVIAVAYKIFSLVYVLVQTFLEAILTIVDLEWITVLLTDLVEKSICRYWKISFANDNSATTGRAVLFFPFVLHKISWFVKKLNIGIRILMYIGFGAGGVYFSYHYLIKGIGEYDTVSVVIAIAMAVIAVAGSLYLGHCVSEAIRDASENAQYLDDFFANYAACFSNMGKKASGNNGYSTDREYQEQGPECDWPEQEENPFYKELSLLATEQELRQRYHDLAKMVHPDKCGDESDGEKMKQLVVAYKKCLERFR